MKTICLAALATLVGLHAAAADNPLLGTWKINPAKSHATGRTITYSKNPGGFHFAGAVGEDYDFALDGKDYPIEGGQLASWKATGSNAFRQSLKVGGKLVTTSDIELSADGQRMTESYTTLLADGTRVPGKVVRTRVSGGPGLLGTWKTQEASLDPDVTVISEPAPGQLRIETPSRHETIEGPTDGTAFAMTGTGVPKDWVATFTLGKPGTLDWSGGFRSQPRVVGSSVVSLDGKVLTETYWYVGKEAEKFTTVSDRQ